jgi:hypothetical protein
VSNNVGIDFTELGPPYGTKPGSAAPKRTGVSQIKKQDDLITIGFRVKPKEKATFKTVNRMDNQFAVDPNTKEPKNLGLSL